MNVLLINRRQTQGCSGGSVIDRRNRDLWQSLVGTNHLVEFAFEARFPSNPLVLVRDRLEGIKSGLDRKHIDELCELIDAHRIDLVWLCSSHYGGIVRTLKRRRPEMCVVTFFHNVEQIFVRGCYANRYYGSAYALLAGFAERAALRYSDHIVALNQRDSNELVRLYGRGANLLLPSSFVDSVGEYIPITSGPIVELLFVGSDFYANISGIEWFMSQVMPLLGVSVRLTIVGQGMERYAERWSTAQVEVAGTVADLAPYYHRAHAVVLPIFDGSGMKTKTAEALMYGRALIASNEALEGYELTASDGVGFRCNTAIEFSGAIGELSKDWASVDLMSRQARLLFLSRFSFEHSLNRLQEWVARTF